MMNRMRTAGIALLTASLCGNVVLARTLKGKPAQGSAADEPDEMPSAADLPSQRLGSEGRACGLESLEAQVAEKSADLRAAMPAELLFAAGQPNSEAEQLMRPIVTEALAALGNAARDPRIRCRDVACEVVFREAATLNPGAWESALVRNADFRSWTSEYGLSEARPVDPGDGDKTPLVERTIHFKLRPAPITADEPGAEMRLHAAEAAESVRAAQKPSFIQRATTKPGERHAKPRQ
jgi:hypothetical protein